MLIYRGGVEHVLRLVLTKINANTIFIWLHLLYILYHVCILITTVGDHSWLLYLGYTSLYIFGCIYQTGLDYLVGFCYP